MLLISIHHFPGLPTHIIRNEARYVRRSVETHQVGYWSSSRSRLETFRLRDNPRRHVTAVAPSHHAETIRIGNAHLNNFIYSRHQILIVSKSPVFGVCPTKLCTVAARTTRVHAQQ